MTETSPPDRVSTRTRWLRGPGYRAAVVDLLGVITYGEISAFERLAEDAKLATELPDKLALGRWRPSSSAHRAVDQPHRLARADPVQAMAPFVHAFDVFHASTPERLARGPGQGLRGGDGLSADFYVEIAQFLGRRHPSPRGRLARRRPARPTSWSAGSAGPSRRTTASGGRLAPVGAAGSWGRPSRRRSGSPPSATASQPARRLGSDRPGMDLAALTGCSAG